MCVLPWDVQETWSRVLSSADVRQLQTSPKSEWPHRVLRHKRIIKSIKQLKPVAMVKKKKQSVKLHVLCQDSITQCIELFLVFFSKKFTFSSTFKRRKRELFWYLPTFFPYFESNRKLNGSFITPRQWPNLESKVLDEWNDHFSEESRLVPSQWIALYRD